MKKIVIYNGGTDEYSNCSNPSVLKKGKEYRVAAISERGWQKEYMLKGVDGLFDASWFDDVYTSLESPFESLFYSITDGIKYVLVFLGICRPRVMR